MIKICENVDMSKKVLTIDVESQIFNSMMRDLDKEIKRVVKKVFDEEFESGEISLKLNIEIPNAYETMPKVDEFSGEIMNETFKYRKPLFEHKITTTLKKQFKQEGNYTDKRDIKFQDGEFIAVPIKEAQMNMSEMLEVN